jgi:hypothetical protein
MKRTFLSPISMSGLEDADNFFVPSLGKTTEHHPKEETMSADTAPGRD